MRENTFKYNYYFQFFIWNVLGILEEKASNMNLKIKARIFITSLDMAP